MDRLRALAIQVARKILAEEHETPGSQTQNLDIARHFLKMIEESPREEGSEDGRRPETGLPQNAAPGTSY